MAVGFIPEKGRPMDQKVYDLINDQINKELYSA